MAMVRNELLSAAFEPHHRARLAQPRLHPLHREIRKIRTHTIQPRSAGRRSVVEARAVDCVLDRIRRYI